jgi:predicted flap endonuclease-1-like 5' DNA nuclease
MRLDLTNPGAAVNTTQKPAVTERPTTTAVNPDAVASTVKTEPSAVEQLHAAEHPLKRDLPEEMLSPKIIALMNSQTKAAVAEAIGGLMEKLLPTFEKLAAPSPKETAELQKEEETKKRNTREWESQKVQLAETKLAERLKQKNCSHLDSNGHERLNCVSNFPDHQKRAFCSGCALWIFPREYRVLPPTVRTIPEAEGFIRELIRQGEITGATPFVDPKTGVTTHMLVDEHPLYFRVKAIESRNAMVII